jgi:pimeloyl-ACP methyl ester carboxylesterase
LRVASIVRGSSGEAVPFREGSPEPLSSITSPTLVIHGTADAMFPIEHGEALAGEIRVARLLRLEGAGHGADRAEWEVVVEAILEHT